MIRSTIVSLSMLMALSVSTAYTQTDFFWNQQSLYNPAATGLDDKISIRSTTTIHREGIVSEQFSADLKSKKLHGAVGLGYSAMIPGDYYGASNSYVNYAFHARTGENSLLSIGTGLSYHKRSMISSSQTVYRSEGLAWSLGAHFRYKNFNAGVSTSLLTNDGIHYHVGIETLYADYTFKLKNDWSLKVAGIATGSPNALYGYRNALTVSARHKDFSFGASRFSNGFGGFVEWNATEKLALGYSINFAHPTYTSPRYELFGQALHVKFRIP